MNKLGGRLMKLERHSPAINKPRRIMDFDDTRENVERQIVAERAKAYANGEELIARIYVPHIGESINEFRIADGLNSCDTPGWDIPRRYND